MAAALHKLIKKSAALRNISSFNNLQSSKLSTPLLLHRTHLIEAKPGIPSNLNPFLGSSYTLDKINSSPSPLHFYPSFPFRYFFDPISVTGVNQSEEVEGVVEDAQTIWADSVKKKRKRKMNKHKYRKLKKRLRRKT